MIGVRPGRIEDVLDVASHSRVKMGEAITQMVSCISAFPHRMKELRRELEVVSRTFTDEHGLPLAVVGYACPTPWRVVLWAAFRRGIDPWQGVQIALATAQMLRNAAFDARVTRVEATASASDAKACRLLELMGLRREALLHRYGEHGEDHWVYASHPEQPPPEVIH